ncbi:MAG: DUF929 family protein [Nostocoides sp.]
MAKSTREAAREKAAKMRAEAERKDKQRRQLTVVVSSLVIVLMVVAVAYAVSQNTKKTPDPGTASVGTAFVDTITSIPAAKFDEAGAPAAASPSIVKVPDGQPTKDGDKPLVYYVGGEFCPYCAGERWALVAALSRFGTFTGLAPTSSADNDGNIPTVTFVKSSYSSDVVSFSAYETQDREGNALQELPDDVSTIFTKYDAPPYVEEQNTGSIPWTWFGPWQSIGSAVPLTDFTGGGPTATVTHDEVATAMANASDGLGKNVLAASNVISAQICTLTDNAPNDVCSSAGVTAAANLLPK